ncbi:hypothetical protein MKY91_16485 [Alkalicoccobacillus gibsonii]|uniref:Uncharacterized protein n=1 Tax=Alkalicoccobacillus gibsonii TaxID=79881 RepID=A0ABU9VLI7_9BACI
MKKWYTLLWLPLVLLFISGFFFLDHGQEIGPSIPGELPTVTVNEEDIMAIRLNHEATRFKAKQLKQTDRSTKQLEQELKLYMSSEMVRKTKQWINGEDVPELDSLLTIDPVNPMIADEFQSEGVSVIWNSTDTGSVAFTYSKPGDHWVLEEIAGGAKG